jgi:hypothetical protein
MQIVNTGNNKSSNELGTSNYHSPTTIINIFANVLKTPAEAKLIEVRGKYEGDSTNKIYGGYYYESLKSEFDSRTLKLKIPIQLRSELQNNSIYNFLGTIEKKISNSTSSIDIFFVIDRILNAEESKITEEDLLKFKVLSTKTEVGYKDFEAKVKYSIFTNQKLKIANLYGSTAIVDRDFSKGIGEAIVNFQITNHRCNLSQPNDIIKEIKKLSEGDFDVIAIVRGGGDDGIKILNNPKIAEQALKVDKIFVTALGHTIHNTLLDQIADKKFALPHDYGVALREIVDRAKEEIQNSKGALIAQVQKDLTKVFGDEIKSLKEQVSAKSKDLELISNKHKELFEKLQQDKNRTIQEISKSKDDQIKVLKDQLDKINNQTSQVQNNYEKLIQERISTAVKQGENKLQAQKNATTTYLVIVAIIAFLIGLIF